MTYHVPVAMHHRFFHMSLFFILHLLYCSSFTWHDFRLFFCYLSDHLCFMCCYGERIQEEHLHFSRIFWIKRTFMKHFMSWYVVICCCGFVDKCCCMLLLLINVSQNKIKILLCHKLWVWFTNDLCCYGETIQEWWTYCQIFICLVFFLHSNTK